MAVDPLENIQGEFSEPVEGFIAWLELERGLSNNTRMAYARDLAWRPVSSRSGFI